MDKWHFVQSGHEIRICEDFQGKPSGVALTIGSRALYFLAPRTGSHRGEKMVYGEFREQDISRAHLIAAAPQLLKELKHLVLLLEPLEQDRRLDLPGLATLNGARAAISAAEGKP